MRIIEPNPFGNGTAKVSLANVAGTRLEVLHEAATPNLGAQFSSYDLVIRFVDKSADKGMNNVADKVLCSIAAFTFTKDPQTNYPRATMTITGQEALAASGLALDKLAVGDYFEVRETMKLTDGRTFSGDNTGSNILGGAFYSSPFLYRINVVKYRHEATKGEGSKGLLRKHPFLLLTLSCFPGSPARSFHSFFLAETTTAPTISATSKMELIRSMIFPVRTEVGSNLKTIVCFPAGMRRARST